MNIILKLLWRWQGRRKLSHPNPAFRYTAIIKLGEIAHPGDFDSILRYTSDPDQTIRNAASHSLQLILDRIDDDAKTKLEQKIIDDFQKSTSLIHQISLIEVIRSFSIGAKEKILAPKIKEAQNDLLYAVIHAIEDTRDISILDDVLQVSDTNDQILRRSALQTWYSGIANQNLDDVLEYITPRLHYLVRATYELQNDGEFLRDVLAHADREKLPHPKAYPDYIIRYFTELLGKWEYDPDAYRSLHAIMVPSYFTFDSSSDTERPFVIL